MICPLLSFRGNEDDQWCDCQKENCGFWDWKEKQCSIVSIGIGSMEYIREKEVNRKFELENL